MPSLAKTLAKPSGIRESLGGCSVDNLTIMWRKVSMRSLCLAMDCGLPKFRLVSTDWLIGASRPS